MSFYQCVAVQFSTNRTSNNSSKKSENRKLFIRLVEVSNILLSVLPKLFKEDFEKLKFHQKKSKKPIENTNKDRHSYIQVSLSNIKDILKIKESFPNLLLKKIEKIHKSINKLIKKKPCINMVIKGSSRRQIIISIDDNNISKFMSLSDNHISNINRFLKNSKSDIMIDIGCSDH